VLVAGSVAMPRTTLLLAAAAVALVFLVTRIDLAILLVVATAPLEGAFASGPGGVSLTKLAGYVCIAAFVLALVKERRRLVFEPGQAIVLAILGIAMLSTAWADDASAAITTTTRYASFAAIYVIITQFGHDRVLQRRIAWTLDGHLHHRGRAGAERLPHRGRAAGDAAARAGRTTSRSSSRPRCRSCSSCSAARGRCGRSCWRRSHSCRRRCC
jgi:hypothetical protein